MWIPISAAMLLLGGAHAAVPAPQDPAQPQPEPAAQGTADLQAAFIALEDEYDEAYEAYRQALMAANDAHMKASEANPGAPYEVPEPVDPAFFPRFDRLAQAGSGQAHLWCIMRFTSDASPEERQRDFSRRIMAVLSAPDVNLKDVPQSIMMNEHRGAKLGRDLSNSLLSLVEAVAVKPEPRSMAAYYLASRAGMGIEDADAAHKAKLEASRKVATRYPDTKGGKQAGGYVFGQERLQVGMVAPDIVGQDVDGNPMKLSDFRGKVTVVDFWGFW